MPTRPTIAPQRNLRTRYGRAAAVFLFTAAHLAAGCAGWPRRSSDTALPAARIEEKPAAADGSKTPATRFAALPKPTPPARLAGFVDPLTKSSDRVPVTLESCLRRALANNLNIQIARFGPAVARTAVTEAAAIFDPSWFMNSAAGRLRQQSGWLLAGANTLINKQWTLATGVDSLLPTGATVALTQDWTYLSTNSSVYQPNPQYNAHLGLTIRQPLLRGAGLEVNRSPIVLARLDREISAAEFKVQLMNTLLAVEAAYWDLVAFETRIVALTEALEAAQENRRIARRRFEEGKDKRLIVSLAESALTSRQADLVSARLRLAQASDRLKRLMNDPAAPLEEPTILEATERPLTEPIPVGRETLQASLAAAARSRPELQQAEARLDQAGVRERVARNARLPQLDATGSYILNGLEPYLDRAIDREFSHNFRDWSAGLEFRVPIGNRGPTAAYERSRLDQVRTLDEREDVRQRIVLEVCDAVRTLAATEEAILATRAARLAAEQTLHDEQANVDAGAALVKDLLDAQRDLADAKVREVEAKVAYMNGLAALERAKGTLLDYNNIRVVDEDVKLPPAPAAGK